MNANPPDIWAIFKEHKKQSKEKDTGTHAISFQRSRSDKPMGRNFFELIGNSLYIYPRNS
jgi:hypothetical protein